VTRVNTRVLGQLLESGLVPVCTAMTHDGAGQMFNTNADTIASSIAVGMASLYDVDLVYCFELPGVLSDIEDEDSVIRTMDSEQYEQLKNDGIISRGMLPKIDNAFDALKKGVRTVRICHADQVGHFELNPAEVGTTITL
jgi:acetylglutamate kinase